MRITILYHHTELLKCCFQYPLKGHDQPDKNCFEVY